jgi:exoribonuclease-2
MRNIYQDRAVLFYDAGVIRIGIVTRENQSRLEIVDNTGAQKSLPPSRICLTGEEARASDDPFATVTSIYDTVMASLPAELDLYKALEGLPTASSLMEVKAKLRVAGDLELFAVFITLRTAKLYFSHKDGMYRGLNEAERAVIAAEINAREQRKDYLDAISVFARAVLNGNEPSGKKPDREYREKFASELRGLQMNMSFPDLASMIHKEGRQALLEEKIIALRVALRDLQADADPILARSGLPVGFGSIAPDTISPGSVLTGKAREALCIDDLSTRDYDDAISLERVDNGWELGIHISAVSSAVSVRSELFDIAANRISSIYLPSQTVNMLPDELSNGHLSLMKGELKPCLSLYARLDNEMELKAWEFRKDMISITRNYTYDEVDKLIANGPFPILNSIAKRLRYLRTGSEQSDKEPFSYYLQVACGIVSMRKVRNNSPARSMVEELMILYNRLAAELGGQNSLPLIHRNISQNASPGSINPPSQAYLSTQAQFHPGIGCLAYLHATSPIRRFTDLLNQYQLSSLTDRMDAPFTREDLDSYIPAIEDRLRSISEVARSSERYWMLRFLEQHWLGVPLDAVFLKKVTKGWQVELPGWDKRVAVICENQPELMMPVKLIVNAVDTRNMLCNCQVIS